MSAPTDAAAAPIPAPARLWRAAQIAALAAVVALFALLVWKVAVQSRGTTLVADIRAGKGPAAPAFDLPVVWARTETWPADLRPALDDGRVTSSELRGRPFVVNFWASWCRPCKAEAPRLAAAARTHAGEVVFLGVDVQDFTSDARRFSREVDAPYVSVRDGGNKTYADYGLTGVPETYYVDARGRILGHTVGEVSAAELATEIRRLVAE